jgi:hypothetical protein
MGNFIPSVKEQFNVKILMALFVTLEPGNTTSFHKIDQVLPWAEQRKFTLYSFLKKTETERPKKQTGHFRATFLIRRGQGEKAKGK